MLNCMVAPSTEKLARLHIESSYCGNTSLQSLMSSALPLELNSYKHNPVVHHTENLGTMQEKVWVGFDVILCTSLL